MFTREEDQQTPAMVSQLLALQGRQSKQYQVVVMAPEIRRQSLRICRPSNRLQLCRIRSGL